MKQFKTNKINNLYAFLKDAYEYKLDCIECGSPKYRILEVEEAIQTCQSQIEALLA